MRQFNKSCVYILSLCFFCLSIGCKKLNENKPEKEKLTQKEIENPKQFMSAFTKGITKHIDAQDIIFFATYRTLFVCENDESLDGITSPEEALAEEDYIKNNTYYVDTEKDYENQYHWENKVIIIGHTYEDEFNSNTFNFNYKKNPHKEVIDIDYPLISKDLMMVNLYHPLKPDIIKTSLNFILKDGLWKI